MRTEAIDYGEIERDFDYEVGVGLCKRYWVKCPEPVNVEQDEYLWAELLLALHTPSITSIQSIE